MLRCIICILGLLLFFQGTLDMAYAEVPSDPVDEAGKIETGQFWSHIYAAYIVTWLSFIGYSISLWVRRGPKGAAE